MDNNVNSDDDRETPSSDQNSSDDDRETPANDQNSSDDDRQTPEGKGDSSDDISSASSETLLPAHEDDPEQMPDMINVRVCTVKVENHSNLPNLTIKYPIRSDDDGNDSFNGEKKFILDEHVKVSRIKSSNLPKNISLLRLDTGSKGKSIGSVTVCRVNQSLSESINDNLNNQETMEIISRQSKVRITRTSTAVNINQGSNRKIIDSKPMVTRVPLINKVPSKKKHKKLHVSVQHVTKNSKKSS